MAPTDHDHFDNSRKMSVSSKTHRAPLASAVRNQLAKKVERSRDAVMMRPALNEHAHGKAKPARELFDDLKKKLGAMQHG